MINSVAPIRTIAVRANAPAGPVRITHPVVTNRGVEAIVVCPNRYRGTRDDLALPAGRLGCLVG